MNVIKTPIDGVAIIEPRLFKDARGFAHGFSVLKLIRYIREELMIVLGTSSSESALPRMLAKMERLGAKKDGVIRGHALRRDGTIRDTVMYSMRSGEWPEARAQLLYLLQRHAQD